MTDPVRVLVLGASYGSLFATKLLLAGHNAELVCTAGTAELINGEGTRVRLPLKGRDGLVEVDSRTLAGKLSAATPDQVDPAAFDLVVLGMQEPQYGSDGVRELMGRVAETGTPCLAIMNMPPLPYLARLPGIEPANLRQCFVNPEVWEGFDPARVTLASPDPQAFRPPEEGKNVLQVSLPTNFKVARFGSDEHTAMLKRLESDIDSVRFTLPDGTETELPVKLRVHDSLFVPLAKWAMLMTGNYRCIGEHEMQSIREAVHGDLDESRAVYEWVVALCEKMGADRQDMVPFEKYARAAEGLAKPSSAARALFGGAPNIERVDKVVQQVAAQHGLSHPAVDRAVTLVDRRLSCNRAVN